MNIKKLSVIALMLAAVAASWYPVLAASGSSEEPAAAPPAMAPTSMPDFTAAAESTINSVVSIKSFVTPTSYGYGDFGGFGGMSDPFFDFFFGNGGGNFQRKQTPPPSGSEDNLRESGLGSGVIISADGYIITNNHVVDGAEKLEVTLNDTRVFSATVIGTDPNTDLALIKIDASDLPVIPWGDSDNLKIGEWVLAVGNPFGLTSTVTAGIVSAKARSISSPRNGKIALESFIQTDAAVNPGNSGGALVNLRGQLVGINSAIYSQTGSYSGYSFAIPTSIVKKIATDLQEYGTVQRALLGILYSELNAKIAQEQGITAVTEGLIVGEVTSGSGAEKAGLKTGDVIIAINDNPTHNSSQLQEQVARFRPGDQANVTFIRDNKKQTVKVTFYNSDGNTAIAATSKISDLGCTFKPVAPATLSKLGLKNGVQIEEINAGPFKAHGLRAGFIILEINNQRISTVADIEKVYKTISSSKSDDHVMFITGLYPDTNRRAYYAVELDQ